jgi:hypothetical protein
MIIFRTDCVDIMHRCIRANRKGDGDAIFLTYPLLRLYLQIHGRFIYEVEHHILPYIPDDWVKYKHIPLKVLAHFAYLNGSGMPELEVNPHQVFSKQRGREDLIRPKGGRNPLQINRFGYQRLK